MKLGEFLKKQKINKSELSRLLKISRQLLRYKVNSFDEKGKGFTPGEFKKVENFLKKDLNFFK